MLTEIKNGKRHIANAYWKAIATIKKHPTRFTSGREAQKLDGIGQKIADKIDEILATGTLQRVQRDRAKAREEAEAAGDGENAATQDQNELNSDRTPAKASVSTSQDAALDKAGDGEASSAGGADTGNKAADG
ncbi:hypothetical protein HK105_208491 [Polyrhizophydium stewartii]|uniref:Crossover junction endonuclease MUS81-like HHH domain-containing protein n=1 Tax=Polyrhizophydium stewartii TaxID=2732419 RepID=A0ABR4MXS1_9FUNG